MSGAGHQGGLPGSTRVVVYSDAVEHAGAETSAANLIAELDARFEVTVMGVDPGVVSWLAGHRAGTDTVIVPEIRSKRDVRAMWRHRRAVANLRPDVFHASLPSVWACQYALLAATTVRGVATVAVEQLPLAGPASRWRRRLKRVVSRRLSAHVAVGRRAARTVETVVGLPEGSLRVIPNGVPDVPVEPEERVGPPPVVGTLARLDHIKGLDVLLHALVHLPAVTAVLVGRGPDEDALRALSQRLGLGERARFAGWSERPRAWLPGFDVFVLPSRLEGTPLSIAEAMLAGRPVVATDVGSVAELVIDGETGILVPADDVDALRAALDRLVGDEELRRTMGERGRARAQRELTAEVMARAYETLYDEITRRAGALR